MEKSFVISLLFRTYREPLWSLTIIIFPYNTNQYDIFLSFYISARVSGCSPLTPFEFDTLIPLRQLKDLTKDDCLGSNLLNGMWKNSYSLKPAIWTHSGLGFLWDNSIHKLRRLQRRKSNECLFEVEFEFGFDEPATSDSVLPLLNSRVVVLLLTFIQVQIHSHSFQRSWNQTLTIYRVFHPDMSISISAE
jgi:hypothetical protein